MVNEVEKVCNKTAGLFKLPAEIRNHILECVFNDVFGTNGLAKHRDSNESILDENYSARNRLEVLLTCRQLYEDGIWLALNQTNFLVSNTFTPVPSRLSALEAKYIPALRQITFVVDARQFRYLVEWQQWPFNMHDLQLDRLTLALHTCSSWHYLFDFTNGLVRLLRRLQGVREIVVLRNNAWVKGGFHPWYNRLVRAIMDRDHYERYEVLRPNLEDVWWEWNFDSVAQSISLQARPSKPVMEYATYCELVRTLECAMVPAFDSRASMDWKVRNAM